MQISINKPKSIFVIFREGFNLYLDNFVSYTREMLYPVLAIVLGIPLSIIPSYLVPEMFPIESLQTLVIPIIALTIALSVPGFALIIHAFWKYLIVMVSLNRYTKGLIDNDHAVTPKACNDYVNKRKPSYAYLLSLMAVIWIIGGIIPLFPLILLPVLPSFLVILMMVVLCIGSAVLLFCLSIYFSLGFQVFAFEEIGAIDVLKKSFKLIENNFFRTILLLIILYIITGIILPIACHTILSVFGIVHLLASSINWFSECFIKSIQSNAIVYQSSACEMIYNFIGSGATPEYKLSKTIVIMFIDGAITAGMLPLGTACFTLLYYDALSRKQPQVPSEDV